MNETIINVEREWDDDCYLYTAQASRMGKSVFATAYTRERAIERAIEKLNEVFGLNPERHEVKRFF
jgi:hypothetical protein